MRYVLMALVVLAAPAACRGQSPQSAAAPPPPYANPYATPPADGPPAPAPATPAPAPAPASGKVTETTSRTAEGAVVTNYGSGHVFYNSPGVTAAPAAPAAAPVVMLAQAPRPSLVGAAVKRVAAAGNHLLTGSCKASSGAYATPPAAAVQLVGLAPAPAATPMYLIQQAPAPAPAAAPQLFASPQAPAKSSWHAFRR